MAIADSSDCYSHVYIKICVLMSVSFRKKYYCWCIGLGFIDMDMVFSFPIKYCNMSESESVLKDRRQTIDEY
jgi:hypothetical protein